MNRGRASPIVPSLRCLEFALYHQEVWIEQQGLRTIISHLTLDYRTCPTSEKGMHRHESAAANEVTQNGD